MKAIRTSEVGQRMRQGGKRGDELCRHLKSRSGHTDAEESQGHVGCTPGYKAYEHEGTDPETRGPRKQSTSVLRHRRMSSVTETYKEAERHG